MKILVPIDPSSFSETVLGPATSIAAGLKAELHLLTIVSLERARSSVAGGESHPAWTLTDAPDWPFMNERPGGSPGVQVETLDEAVERLQQEARGHLDKLAQTCNDTAVFVEVTMGSSPARAIDEYAAAQQVDLIAMATHSRGTLGRTLLGSVTEATIRESGRPVLLVGPRYQHPETTKFRSLLVCVDGSPHSEAILPAAAALAEALGLRPVLVGVMRLDWGHFRTDAAYLKLLSEGLSREGHEVSCKLLYGDPAEAITTYAAELPGSMIAMSTHGRTGLARITLGAVAMKTARLATCPVLVQRPQEQALA